MFKKFFKRNKKEEVKEIVQEEVKEVTEEAATEETISEESEIAVDTTVDEAKVKEEQVEIKDNQEVEGKIEEPALEESITKEDEIEDVELVEEIQIAEETNTTEEVVESKEEKVSLFERLKQGLSKAKQGITDKVDQVLKSYTKVDEELLEEIEEILITADVGVDTTMSIIDKLTDAIKTKKITNPQDVKGELKLIIKEILTNDNSKLDVSHNPTIIVMVGVNGVGKTTTIGKLASRYKKEGKKVLIAAGDTFRAAAINRTRGMG